jgi:TolB-like protein/Tfp pilus assembly protein PilF
MARLYLVGAWLLTQAASTMLPMFGAAEWPPRIVILCAIGFIPALILSWVFELTPEGFKRDAEVRPEESIGPQTGRRMDRMFIVVLVLALAYFAVDKFVLNRPREKSTANTPVPESTATPNEKSVAVLAFANLSDDKGSEYFSDGISEELLSVLQKIPGLHVAARTSAFSFKGKNATAQEIGQKLGVYYLVEGSVRKSVDQVRITVALVKAGDGVNVWSATYDRELKEIFAVQSEIAGAVAKGLKVPLLGNNGQAEQFATAARPSNQNVEAYHAFLQGDFHLNRRTAEDFRKAIGYYEEAIRLDPRYALANAKLSLAAASLAINFADKQTAEREALIAKSRASAERALKLDPNLADAHGARAVLLLNVDFNYAAAETEFRRALELAPQNLSVTANLAHLMSTFGRLDEAVALMRQAIALDPLRTGAHFNLAGYLTALGRYDEAEAELRKETELQPSAAVNYRRLAEIQILRGNPGKAVELAKQETNPFWHTHALALAHFANGDLVEADAALQKLIDENADDCGSQIAQVYALRKEPEKMFQWLERAWTTRDPGVTNLLFDPILRAYKDDPRFIAFAQKIGVMPKAAGNP